MYQANILLVDDETAILQLLTTILEKVAYFVKAAEENEANQ